MSPFIYFLPFFIDLCSDKHLLLKECSLCYFPHIYSVAGSVVIFFVKCLVYLFLPTCRRQQTSVGHQQIFCQILSLHVPNQAHTECRRPHTLPPVHIEFYVVPSSVNIYEWQQTSDRSLDSTSNSNTITYSVGLPPWQLCCLSVAYFRYTIGRVHLVILGVQYVYTGTCNYRSSTIISLPIVDTDALSYITSGMHYYNNLRVIV